MKKLVLHPPVDPDRLEKITAAAGAMQVVNADSPEQALQEIADATAFFGKMTPELLAASERLEWVQSPTASLEHYLFPDLIAHPCRVSNMRGLFGDVIADHVFGFILMFARNLHRYLRHQIAHKWEPVGDESTRQSYETGPGFVSEIDRRHLHLADCTLGVVGVGDIGAEICRRGKAFGMKLCGVDAKRKTVEDIGLKLWEPERLNDLLTVSDFVVIAAPHTPDTEKLFRRDQFQQMKTSSFLINIGRGIIVDLADLTAALQAGEIAGAALDVYETEPLPEDHPLWEMENVILTPHIAAASPRIAERHLETLLENIRRYVTEEELLTPVNKEKWY
ncbi:MAG: D-2-hydroxyacid dehydrogenase [Planctomycetaceae bacterium]|nr:D-2-hydroxyacid dehydrogenase [Planctomycetaceae bacterium]